MKIAIIGPCNPREFSERLGLDEAELPQGLGGTPINSLVQWLLTLGHFVHLISASPDVKQTRRYSGNQLTISLVPYRVRARNRALDLFRAERKAMSRELHGVDADVVHAHWAYEFGWVGVTSGLPNVLTVHDAPLSILRRMPDAYRILRTIMAYAVSSQATIVSAVSPDLAAKWRYQMRFKGEVGVVPNISPEFGALDPMVAKPEVTVITDIADATRLKNVRRLLEAYNKFRMHVPRSELRLIGRGLGERDGFARWAQSEGLADNVKFLGHQSRADVSRHLSESTMLCHASLEESQGMCFLEAMSHSVPVIGGINSGGVAWTLDEGRAGSLVDVSSAEAIFRGMLEMVENTELRNEYVGHAHDLLTRRFSGEVVASAYVGLYEKAIAEFQTVSAKSK